MLFKAFSCSMYCKCRESAAKLWSMKRGDGRTAEGKEKEKEAEVFGLDRTLTFLAAFREM